MEDKWLEASDINVEEIMKKIRERVEDKKKKGIYKEEEIKDIENVELFPLPDILDVPIVYSPEDLERGFEKVKELSNVKLIELEKPPQSKLKIKIRNLMIKIRNKIFPLLNFISFFTLSELYASTDLNKEKINILVDKNSEILNLYKEHLKILHNYIHHITAEITKLKIENDELKVKLKETESKLGFLEDRERTLEKETIEKE
jgi:hypothetical protein